MKPPLQQRGFFQLSEEWLRRLQIRQGRAELREPATWLPLPHPAAPQLSGAAWTVSGPRGWGSASPAIAADGSRANEMDVPGLTTEGTKNLVLRFAHLLKSLVSFHVSRARQRETSRGREQPPYKANITSWSRVPPSSTGLAGPLANRGRLGAWREAVSLPVWSPERVTEAHRWSH